MTLALYGHPFASYVWKPLIALYAEDIPFEFRMIDGDHPRNVAFVRSVAPLGKFPVLVDGGTPICEAICILERIAHHHAASDRLLPRDPALAAPLRFAERVIDLYVMNPMQDMIGEYLRAPGDPDQARVGEARERLERAYHWLERWLEDYRYPADVTVVECCAAPSLFYADWCHPISEAFPRLRQWRAHVLALPSVARVVDEARPFRPFFPLGAPDRD